MLMLASALAFSPAGSSSTRFAPTRRVSTLQLQFGTGNYDPDKMPKRDLLSTFAPVAGSVSATPELCTRRPAHAHHASPIDHAHAHHDRSRA